ncbi:MAG TPA: CehA/McbA family metallohydrolase [Mycobacteriales bacterium]|jgi:hypothetical protein|nr:CehA/McbA family metallohydrolase [Mycobacteriales bacterium]
MTVHSGLFTRDERAASVYQYLPVEVPAGAVSLEVVLAYDSAAGVIDLGCVGPGGFRGWSGGARDRFVIAPDAATPGYLPGPLEPGIWQVALGLHRVGPAGVSYEVTARTGALRPDPLPAAPGVPARPARRDLPAPPGLRWLAGDCHAHTVHSDGSQTIEQLAAAAVEQGLDFLAVTDHNTVSHHRFLAEVGARYGIILLPGQEVTTDTGHANAFGYLDWIDFRRPAQDWVAEVERRGGLLSINHPLAGDCAWRQPLTRHPALAEVWHWTWLDPRWGGPIAWWQAWGLETIPVGGSDFHAPEQGRPVGTPTTWVLAEEDSVDGVLAAMRAGRTAVSAGRGAPVLLRSAGELRAIDADGTLLVGPDGRRSPVRGDSVTFPAAAGPYRLDNHEGGIVAIGGPGD